MTTVHLRKWKSFAPKIAAIINKYPLSQILFPGQSDASWRLETTLERYPVKLPQAKDYFRAMLSARPQIETYTNQSWSVPTEDEFIEALKREAMGQKFPDLPPAYEYMIYLRHHGFPSPLLDWTTSPYVAAFFAFSKAVPSPGRVSIYVYIEYPSNRKGITFDANISVHGSSIRSHRRHFLQQCTYTTCTVKKEEEWQYTCHEDVFDQGSEIQDFLWKFNLPASERTTVLRDLDRYNLNSYSLFGTEESLMETVAQRKILFRLS